MSQAPIMPSAETCLSYQCGADPQNLAGRYACAYYGMYGVHACNDPVCTPYCPNQQVMAAAVAAPASASAPITTLTPQSIVQAIPSVTLQPAPIVIECDWWSGLNAGIANNPIFAAAALGILGVAVLSSHRRRSRR